MAALLNLSTTSSLLQYEKGSKPISGLVRKRLADLTNVSAIQGTLFTAQKADGMQLGLEISGHIMHCTCGIWFIAKKRNNVFHQRICQLHDWRKRKRKGQP